MKKEEISLATKQQLAQALKNAMAKKPFEKIKVSDLLSATNLTRPTFYYHFQDIYALLEWMFENEAISLLQKSEDCYTWDEGVLLLMRYVQNNSAVCLCAYHSLGRDAMERMFFRDVEKTMKNIVETLAIDIPAKQEHKDFIIDFYTRAFVSTLVSWLTSGMKQSPEEMVDLLDVTMHGTLAAALKRSADE